MSTKQIRTRPQRVTIAAITQLLIGLAFLSIPIIGLVYGSDTQAAVDAEVVRQGHDAAVLANNNIHFDENGAAIAVPVVIAVIMAVLAVLNLKGKRSGLIASRIIQPLVLLFNFVILASQAGVAETLKMIFEKTGDAALQSLNIQKLLDAANSAYPDWLPALVDVRNVVVVAGSLLVIGILFTTPTKAYFRKNSKNA
jgi:hypothetical protein